MMIKPLRNTLMLAAGALLLAACGGGPAPQVADEPTARLEGPVVDQRWNLLLVGTDERLEMPERPHFVIDRDGRVSGSDGCNRLTGRAALGDNNRIAFSDLATTRRACPRAEDAARVTGMLENAYRYLIDHDRLVFFGPDQRVLGGWRRVD
ncbi:MULTISPECIES: META domain-containing protein [Halomonas]|uniref:Heat shock protein HslJ n=1 Tax=Halomonas ventosae TaxID=229007 RepID=A0A2T0VIC3_9GAMM|nr:MULTISPECIES: META domain-containing protein [Halomonas]PRY69807.1 heat shock protein HslJ [Halomonas ventosae]WFM71763.1 META domain-containing protein [Halomonas sp. CKK8]